MKSTNKCVRDLNLPTDFWGSSIINLDRKTLDSLDGCPAEVLGSFSCSDNFLKSLADGPSIVQGGFSCGGNGLTSLVGGPETVHGGFFCRNNHLTSLAYCPRIVRGSFSFSNNKLTSLADIHTDVQQMDGVLDIGGNPIASHILGVLLIRGCRKISCAFSFIEKDDSLQRAVAILNCHIAKGRAGIMDCQAEMIAHGLGDFAQI